MELMSLGSDFRDGEIIDGWNSLVWTERYIDNSDFELKTYDVRNTMHALPLDSFVSLSDTREVMIVENHEIQSDSNGVDILTVSGRSAETFFEYRTSTSDAVNNEALYPSFVTLMSMSNTLRADWLAEFMIWSSVVNAEISHKDTAILLPGVRVTNSVIGTVPNPSIDAIGRADLYSEVLSALAESRLGIRSRRPVGSTENVVSYEGLLSSDGVRTVTTQTVENGLSFDIYGQSSKIATVVFDSEAGDFSSYRLLRSNKGFMNYIDLYGSDFKRTVTRNNGMPSASGWANRRAIIEYDDPQVTPARATRKARRDLRKNSRKTYLNEFVLNPNSTNYTYGVDYSLGDEVSIMAGYGVSDALHVVEYSRSMTPSGYSVTPLLGDLE